MFYPQDFTYVCPTEVLSLARKFEDFQQIDCNILACSTDSVACHRAWMKLPGKLGGIGTVLPTFLFLAKILKILLSIEGVGKKLENFRFYVKLISLHFLVKSE